MMGRQPWLETIIVSAKTRRTRFAAPASRTDYSWAVPKGQRGPRRRCTPPVLFTPTGFCQAPGVKCWQMGALLAKQKTVAAFG